MDREVELRWVAGLQRGDEKAFDAVYERFRPKLFGFLVRLSKRQDLAEDLLQETWIRLATKASLLQPDTQLGPWLFTVARNLYLSYRRWHLLDGGRVHDLFRLRVRDEAPQSPFEATAATELSARIERAIARLPLAYREVLLLVAGEGMTPAEAAAVCELKPAALRKRLSRARSMVAEDLAKAVTQNEARP